MNNQQIVFNAATEMGVPAEQAVYITTQAMVESADFTSHLFQTDNNAFGMKVPNIRKSKYISGPSVIVNTSEGTTPYAHYNSLDDSAKDIVAWLDYNGIDWNDIKSQDDYSAFLNKNGYYGVTQDTYTAALVHYYNEAKKAIGDAFEKNQGAVIATGATIFLMLVYFVIRIARAKSKK